MSPFVESARRLYLAGSLKREKVDGWLSTGTVTQAEYEYITA